MAMARCASSFPIRRAARFRMRRRGSQRGAYGLLHLPDVADDAQLHQCLTAQHCVGATEEGRVPAVLALLDGAVEEGCLAAERIGVRDVGEPLGRLDQGDLRILEPAECAVEDAWIWDLVGVEHEQELAMGAEEGVVEVARLRVTRLVRPVLMPVQVADPERLGGAAHLGTVPVVEDPGFVGVVDPQGGRCGGSHHLHRLVVRRDEDVDGRPRRRRRRVTALADAPHGEPEEIGVDE